MKTIITLSLLLIASPCLGKEAYPSEAPAKVIVKSKVSLGNFPRSEDPASRAAKLVPKGDWLKVESATGPKDLLSPDGKTRVSFRKFAGDTGDFERFTIFVRTVDHPAITLSKRPIGWAAFSPNSKYIAIEPLTLIDLKTMKSYDVSKEIAVPNYIQFHFWSRDSRSMIISQTDCAMDCRDDDKFAYWRVDLK